MLSEFSQSHPDEPIHKLALALQEPLPSYKSARKETQRALGTMAAGEAGPGVLGQLALKAMSWGRNNKETALIGKAALQELKGHNPLPGIALQVTTDSNSWATDKRVYRKALQHLEAQSPKELAEGAWSMLNAASGEKDRYRVGSIAVTTLDGPQAHPALKLAAALVEPAKTYESAYKIARMGLQAEATGLVVSPLWGPLAPVVRGIGSLMGHQTSPLTIATRMISRANTYEEAALLADVTLKRMDGAEAPKELAAIFQAGKGTSQWKSDARVLTYLVEQLDGPDEPSSTQKLELVLGAADEAKGYKDQGKTLRYGCVWILQDDNLPEETVLALQAAVKALDATKTWKAATRGMRAALKAAVKKPDPKTIFWEMTRAFSRAVGDHKSRALGMRHFLQGFAENGVEPDHRRAAANLLREMEATGTWKEESKLARRGIQALAGGRVLTGSRLEVERLMETLEESKNSSPLLEFEDDQIKVGDFHLDYDPD